MKVFTSYELMIIPLNGQKTQVIKETVSFDESDRVFVTHYLPEHGLTAKKFEDLKNNSRGRYLISEMPKVRQCPRCLKWGDISKVTYKGCAGTCEIIEGYYKYKKKDRRRAREYLEEALNPSIGGNEHIARIEYSKDIGTFNCALTGDSIDNNEIVFDHFIALSTGHLGATPGNIIPLRYDLNMDKLDNNPLEWGRRTLKAGKIKEQLWNSTLIYLSTKLGLLPSEYEEFVYWCYANPRSIEQIILDIPVSSIELWRRVK